MPRSVYIRIFFLSIITICMSCEDPDDTLEDNSAEESLDERGFPVATGFQAENRTAASGCRLMSNHAGFTGSGFMDYGGNGTWIEWNNVNASQAGEYQLVFRYAVGGSPRQSAIIVNGASKGNLGFANTGSWTSWKTNTKTVALRQGNNTVRVMANTGNGGPNLDSMEIRLIGGQARITASGENLPREGKDRAFDGRTDTKWLDFADSAWIQYEFGGGASRAVNKYTITSANDYPERDPRNWKLKGSNNGSNWTTLDTRTNQTFSARFQKKTYTFSNATRYKIYRLDISTNLNPPAANSTQLAEIELLEGDIVDECPNDPNKTEPGECGCGVPEGSCNGCTNVLLVHEKLLTGEHLCSQNGKYEFGLTPQGELAIREGTKTLWSAGTFGSNVHLVMQGDGNLVVYNSIKPLWDSKTQNNAGATLKLENDGRVVIRLGTKVLWSRGGDGPVDLCPGDPDKTEPGQCGCGVPEGTCNGGRITHIGTTQIWDANGQNINIARPSGSRTGDLLILALHRTDDDLPLYVDGWTRVAECYKRSNGYDCSTEDDCTSWHNDDFCGSFGGHGGHDLAQSIFFKRVGSSEPSSYRFNLNTDSNGHPGWIILTALRGANTNDPVRDWSYKGCDGVEDSLFPSVYGQKGDMVLLSQSFDDAVAKGKFNAPDGTSTFGYVSNSDEAGFLFGGILSSTGETGKMRTRGDGASSCKDALVSLTIKAQ